MVPKKFAQHKKSNKKKTWSKKIAQSTLKRDYLGGGRRNNLHSTKSPKSLFYPPKVVFLEKKKVHGKIWGVGAFNPPRLNTTSLEQHWSQNLTYLLRQSKLYETPSLHAWSCAALSYAIRDCVGLRRGFIQISRIEEKRAMWKMRWCASGALWLVIASGLHSNIRHWKEARRVKDAHWAPVCACKFTLLLFYFFSHALFFNCAIFVTRC